MTIALMIAILLVDARKQEAHESLVGDAEEIGEGTKSTARRIAQMSDDSEMTARYLDTFPEEKRDYFQCFAFLRASGLSAPRAYAVADQIFTEGVHDAPVR
jgi:hypothetical protein